MASPLLQAYWAAKDANEVLAQMDSAIKSYHSARGRAHRNGDEVEVARIDAKIKLKKKDVAAQEAQMQRLVAEAHRIEAALDAKEQALSSDERDEQNRFSFISTNSRYDVTESQDMGSGSAVSSLTSEDTPTRGGRGNDIELQERSSKAPAAGSTKAGRAPQDAANRSQTGVPPHRRVPLAISIPENRRPKPHAAETGASTQQPTGTATNSKGTNKAATRDDETGSAALPTFQNRPWDHGDKRPEFASFVAPVATPNNRPQQHGAQTNREGNQAATAGQSRGRQTGQASTSRAAVTTAPAPPSVSTFTGATQQGGGQSGRASGSSNDRQRRTKPRSTSTCSGCEIL